MLAPGTATTATTLTAHMELPPAPAVPLLPGRAVPATRELLPDGIFRGLMRAAESQALEEQRLRSAGLDHAAISQLAQSESLLLVDVETAIVEASEGAGGSHGGGGAEARNLLRTPLDEFAATLRGLLARYFDDETMSVKRALAGLAADLGAVHEQEAKRARTAIAHIKHQFNERYAPLAPSAAAAIFSSPLCAHLGGPRTLPGSRRRGARPTSSCG